MYLKQIDCTTRFSKEEFVESIRNTGFAVIRSPLVNSQLIFEVYNQWQHFFNSDYKFMHHFNVEQQEGYFPFRSENAKSYDQKDLKEFFHYYRNTKLPFQIGTETEVMFQQLEDLGALILEILDEHLPAEIKAKLSMPLTAMGNNSPQTLLRVLHYPPLSGLEERGAVRAYEHEDINLITLLPAATSPGLEVKDAHGNWHEIECDPGAIVVNVGDALSEATQNYYRSTTHRVVNPEGPGKNVSRFSMPFFLHARPDVRLSERHTAVSFLHERLRELGLKKP